MAAAVQKYVLGTHRLARALRDGFTLTETGSVSAAPQTVRHLLFRGLDSARPDCPWGRVSFRAVCEGDLVLTVRAFATNDPMFLRKGVLTPIDDFLLDEALPVAAKLQFFGIAGGLENSGASDFLLYPLKGRYLHLWIELSGEGSAILSDCAVYVPGDNFLGTFPAVYQTEDDFFRRYLSIFSTLYNDFQEKIDHVERILDLDTAPPEALPQFAAWLGLELEGSLTDADTLRRVLKATPMLLAVKGTRRAIEGVVRLFVTEPFYLVERNQLSHQQLDDTLYGSSPYDFTLLIRRAADEGLRTRLLFFINQFKPMRSRCRILFLDDSSGLDAFTYLDFNGTLLPKTAGVLDVGRSLSGTTYLN